MSGVEELFWSQDAYSYITKQSDLFDAMLPELTAQYAGMYVLFEDGNVINADLDEDILLDRIWETEFIRDRIAKYNSIFCHLVPEVIIGRNILNRYAIDFDEPNLVFKIS